MASAVGLRIEGVDDDIDNGEDDDANNCSSIGRGDKGASIKSTGLS
jgi:hypothetical protein